MTCGRGGSRIIELWVVSSEGGHAPRVSLHNTPRPRYSAAYLVGLLHALEVSGVILSGVHLVTRGESGRELVEFLQAVPLVVDREWHDLEAHDAGTLELSEVLVVLEDDAD